MVLFNLRKFNVSEVFNSKITSVRVVCITVKIIVEYVEDIAEGKDIDD